MGTWPDDERDDPAGRAFICEDYGDWVISKGRMRQCRIEAGLTDAQGRAVSFTVELRVYTDARNKNRSFVFTLMKRNRSGQERVFQLAVNQGAKPPKDEHQRSHEHLGGLRIDLPQTLAACSFDELLQYFCTRTNVAFRPIPFDPVTLLGRI